jgi:tetratricopeptide (TPR) repeat protein
MLDKRVIIIGICIFLQQFIFAQKDTSNYFEQGVSYFKNKQYNEALLYFNKAIEQNPNSSKAYNNRGIVKRAQNNSEEAIADFSKAIELNPNNIPAYKNRGLTYMNKNQYWEAFNDFNIVLLNNPNDEVVLKNYLLVKNILKIDSTPKTTSLTDTTLNTKDSISYLPPASPAKKEKEIITKEKLTPKKEKIKKEAPVGKSKEVKTETITDTINVKKEVPATKNKEKIKEKEAAPKTEKKPFKDKEVKYTPSENSAEKIQHVYNLTTTDDLQKQEGIKNKTAQMKSAYIHYTKLIQADSNNAHAYLYRGKLKSDLSNYKSIDSNNEKKSYTEKLEEALITRDMLSGEFGAIDDYSRAIQLNPLFYEAYYYRALSLYNMKRFKNAISDFSKALELNPNMPEAYYYRGITKGILNDMSGACVDLIKASEMGYNEADEIAKECK